MQSCIATLPNGSKDHVSVNTGRLALISLVLFAMSTNCSSRPNFQNTTDNPPLASDEAGVITHEAAQEFHEPVEHTTAVHIEDAGSIDTEERASRDNVDTASAKAISVPAVSDPGDADAASDNGTSTPAGYDAGASPETSPPVEVAPEQTMPIPSEAGPDDVALETEESVTPPLPPAPALLTHDTIEGEVDILMDAHTCGQLLDDVNATLHSYAPKPERLVHSDVSRDVEYNKVAYQCRESELTETTRLKDVGAIDMDHVVAGLIVRAEGLQRRRLDPIPADRSTATLVVDAPGVAEPSFTVHSPDLGTLQNATNTLIGRAAATTIPANLSVAVLEVYSSSDIEKALGLNDRFEASALGAKVEVGTDFFAKTGANVKRKTIAVLIRQNLFNLSVADDEHPFTSDWFAEPELVRQRLATDCGGFSAESPPAFIKTVRYGRLVLYLFTSSSSKTWSEFKAKVSTAFSYMAVDGKLAVEGQSKLGQLLESSEVQALAVGGDQETTFEALQERDPGLFFRMTPANLAVPLSFTSKMLTANRQDVPLSETRLVVEEQCDWVRCADAGTVEEKVCEGYHSVASSIIGTSEDRSLGCNDAESEGYVRSRYTMTQIKGSGHCEPKPGNAWIGEDPTNFAFVGHWGVSAIESRTGCNWEIFGLRPAEHPDELCSPD